MDKFALQCAIRHVYFNDYGLDKVFILSDLSALFLYYMDDDTPEDIIYDYRKLQVWLVKHEFIRKYVCAEKNVVPKDYHCEFKGNHMQNLTFSPVVNIPETEDRSLSIAQASEFANELNMINIPAIALYVKKRIRQMGDLDFVESEDEDACRPQI
ncbi:MAG: hypothetical protein IKQ90_10360 [Ruminococcus sp.]|nr:hypothetical protein [Ruminococcus sp.]